MTNEKQHQLEIIKGLEEINHPNISIEIFPPDKRISDFERVPIIYPLTKSNFALFELNITNGVSIFSENTNYQFISKYLYISSSIGVNHYFRSDGSLDGKGTSCKLFYEKDGIKSFELVIDSVTDLQYLALNLNDKNIFRSVGFKPSIKIPDNFIKLLNDALKINKWI